jgi:hypothetical protein
MIDELADLRKLDLPFNVDKVAPQCHECIRKQIAKYEQHAVDGKIVGNKFLVPCTGSQRNLYLHLKKQQKQTNSLK